MRVDCCEGGEKVEAPVATRHGAMLVTPVDMDGQPYAAQRAPTVPVGGILKRLTALLAVLPERLGRRGSTDSLSVTTASDELTCPTATVRRVECKEGTAIVLRPNAARKRFYIHNESRHRLYVRFGSVCTWESFSFALEPGHFYESKGYPAYTGTVTVYVHQGRDGAVMVTEM